MRYCQSKGNWQPFTYEALNNFYEKNGRLSGFHFNRLIQDGYVIENGKWYSLTELFVAKCYGAQFSKTPTTAPQEPHAPCPTCNGDDIHYGVCGVCQGGNDGT